MFKVIKLLVRIFLSIIAIIIFNTFQSITHITISLNIFSIIMITFFDIFGFILCIVLKLLL